MNYLEQNCLNQKVELTNISELEFEISQDDENTKTVVFCNLITTSFDSEIGDILRINLKYASINQRGEFCRVSKTLSMFEVPERELSEEEKRFLDFDIKTKRDSKINWDSILNVFKNADIIVAHNASFVRPFIRKHVEEDCLWGCTLDFIDWNSMGFPSKNLSTLSVFSGLVYNFSDSLATLDSLLHVISKNNKFTYLLNRCEQQDLQVYAANSKRDSNTVLKRGGYRWNPDVTCWWKNARDKSHAEEEALWLKKNVPGVEPQIFEVDKKYRFLNN